MARQRNRPGPRGSTGFQTVRDSLVLAQLVVGLVAKRGRSDAEGEGPSENLTPLATAPVETAPEAVEPAPAPAPPEPEPQAEPAPPEPEPQAEPAPRPAPSRTSWGWVAGVGLAAAVGLLLMTGGNALSRAGEADAEPFFWGGFLVMIVPVAARLASRGPDRVERAATVAVLGVLLYVAKVLHDPFTFTYSDEFLHLSNAEQIMAADGLFPDNPMLPVTVFYPGLEAVTAGLADLTGMSAFAAGAVVVGAARLTLMLALFLLFERLSGSHRVAGLAALVYAANPNFLFWSGQFSYQSLALPLAVFAVMAVALRSRGRETSDRLGWTVAAMLAMTAVVMTHHLTAYAVVALLVILSIATRLGAGRASDAAWGLVVFASVAAVVWLVQVAPLTDQYLSFIFERTFEGVSDTLVGTTDTRQLFESSSGQQAEVWERAVGLSSVLLISLALPFGLWIIWRRRRTHAMLPVFALGAVAYLAILPMRLVPSAWETANRASDFLFLGIGISVALAGSRVLWRRRRAAWLVGPAAVVFVAAIAVGGTVAGWPPSVRLSQPYRALVGDHEVEPQGAALARASLDAIGPGHRIAADESNGRLLLAQGRQLPLAARDGRVRALLEDPELQPVQRESIRGHLVGFVAMDRREIASDNLAGYFFAPTGEPREGREGLIDPRLLAKFDRPEVDRIVDTGDVVLYDVRRIEP